MTTITTTKPNTRFLVLKNNQTGFFAVNTIHEIKRPRSHLIMGPALSPRFRNNNSPNLLFASSEQKQHQLQQYRSSRNEIEQYYPLVEYSSSTIDSSNDSRLNLACKRNGFPPSTIRHQKPPPTNLQRNNNHYENKNFPPKSTFMQSHASARLRSEIDYLSNKLKRHEESSKSLRLRDSRNVDDTLFYSTSCRLPSAVTPLIDDRVHKRFSSAATHCTANTHVTIPTINNTSNQSIPIPSDISALNTETEDNQPDTTDHRLTYAYQIPQQSNVGSESVFLTDSLVLSSPKTRSTKIDRYPNDLQTVTCPFYGMYLTNLAIHQAQSRDKEKKRKPSTMHNPSVNLRTSTVIPRHQSAIRQVNRPLSMNTYLTIDDNVYTTNSTPFPHNKRLLGKISTTKTENSYRLRNILRTSSWYHV